MSDLGDALGVIEVASIARGMVVCDALVKRAAVCVLRSHAVDPGKYLIIFRGPVAEVLEAFDAGEAAAGKALVDKLVLTQAHEALGPAIEGTLPRPELDALGIVETYTLCGAVVGLDVALKAARVQPVELRLAAGMGGKGVFVITGEQHDVEAAVEAAVGRIGPDALSELIARPHADFLKGAL